MDELDTKSHSYVLCKAHYEDIFSWKQLKMLRFATCEAIFKVILKNYADSL